jgi:hypothetical protein
LKKAIMIRVRMDEVKHRMGNVTGKQLAEITGLREADISEISNNQRTTLNKEKLCILATAAKMDISELLEMVWVDE